MEGISMIRNLFMKKREPVFLKEDSSLVESLEELKAMLDKLKGSDLESLERDIFLIEQGITGEKNVEFELRNSYFPIIVLKDLYYELGDQTAQIDFLVFTSKLMFIIECKNLYGNLTIDRQGNFVRTLNYGKKTWKEGIYSPITQNQRHKDLLHKMTVESKTNLFKKYLADSRFDKYCIPVVVLANPKTVLEMNNAPRNIKNNVIRADQLIAFIRNHHNISKEEAVSEKAQMRWAQFYLNAHQEKEDSFLSKYKTILANEIPIEERGIYKELKKYRLVKSREEKIKAYYIYTNKQLEELILSEPACIEDIMKLAWMSELKINKYAQDILNIFQEVKE